MFVLVVGLVTAVVCTALLVLGRRARRPRTDGGTGDADGAETNPPASTDRVKPPGLRRWLTTVDHRDIGLLYLLFGVVAGVWGGVDAMMIRSELLTPDATIWTAETYNSLFTAHGITMLFFFATPIFSGIANYVLPPLLDADDMAFPRINAIAFWLLPPALVLARAGLITELIAKAFEQGARVLAPVAGGLLSWVPGVTGPLLAVEPPATGWTLYPPLSLVVENPQVNLLLIALHLSGVATTLGAINFVVTIVMERGEGVSWANLDLFSWSMLTMSGLVLFAFPVLGSTLVMLLLDRAVGTTFFTVPGGGPILFQHLFWFFGHPEVYILVLPSFGLVSFILPKFAGRKLFGFRFVVYSTLAIGVLSFGVWAHHMFTTGMDPRLRASFMAVSIAIAVPSAVKTFNWITTMWNGSVRLTAPMLFCLGGISLFVVGGITGVFLASIPVDLVLHDTYYVVGHFHLIVMGIIPFGMFAASYYWYPLVTGRMYDRTVAKVQAVVTTVGSFVTFVPMLAAGTGGLPRRYALYPEVFALGQQLSTVGAYLLGVGGVLWAFNVVQSYRVGRPVTDPDVWNLAETGQLTREWELLADRLGVPLPANESPGQPRPTEDGPDDDADRSDAGADRSDGRNPVHLVVGTTAAVAVLALVGLLAFPVETFDSTTEAIIRTLNRQFLLIAVPLALFVEALLVYAALRFRNNGNPLPTPEHKRLEITWTVATALLLLFVGVLSYQGLVSPYVAATPDAVEERPADAVEIEVVAEQFHYTVRYPEAGVAREPAEVIYVPANRPVYVETTSTDVIHSVHVPELGLKQDALPGQWNVVHTRATDTGDYRLYCAEFCGASHSRMQATVRVVPPDRYSERLAALANGTNGSAEATVSANRSPS